MADTGDKDDRILQDLGYKPELFRGFGCLMNFTFCFTAVAVISSISGLFPTAILTGGPAIIMWSWIVVSVFTVLVALSLAEICSTYPSAGSVYYWAGALASAKHAPLVSYFTGWFNFLGNIAGDAFFGYSFASAVNGAVIMNGGREMSTGVQVGIGIAVCFIWTVMNLLRIDKQGWMTNFAAIWQTSATIIIVVTILVTCSRQHHLASPDQVFFQTYNGTGFSSMGYVTLIGLLSALYSFSGYEAGGHMAEETRGAYKSAPMGILWTCVTSAIVGFIYWLGLLFASASDVAGFVSHSGSTTSIFEKCTGTSIGFTLSLILIVNMYFSGQSSLTVTARIVFAMARDGALPGSSILKVVNSKTQTPTATVILVFLVDSLLLLLNLVNSTAFIAVTSIATIGYQISYAIPIFMRLTYSSNTFVKGPFNLGRFGEVTGWISVIFLSFTSLCFLFPTSYPITMQNMNYTPLILIFTLAIGIIHWNFFAKHDFTGPGRKRAPV